MSANVVSGNAVQFGRFLVAGGAAAVANYGSRFAFSLWLPFEVAICLAFCVGLVVGFLLMRQFVFDGRGKQVGQQVVRYLCVNLLALVQTLAVSVVLARWLLPHLGIVEHREAIAHGVGVALPIVTSYFGHRHATFR
jgi:putative flippase GtrA